MQLAIFGLSVSSSWGNGHATLWRGLIRALASQGHQVHFFEKDVPWYANARDLISPDHFRLTLYKSWDDAAGIARQNLRDADAAIVTSFCPDALEAAQAVFSSPVPAKVFYDLDTPVTLARRRAGLSVDWATQAGYADYDLVLSYSGGRTLNALRRDMLARNVAPLYGSVDPDLHRPVPAVQRFALSYLGTYAEDRQAALETLFLASARQCPLKQFLLGGSQYPQHFPWTSNLFFRNHVAPEDHNSFYCSSEITLNITRKAMLESGYCPSGRLFETAACGVPALTDDWAGIGEFFEPDREILIATNTAEAVDAISRSHESLLAIGRAARERALSCHTSAIRAEQMIRQIEKCMAHEPVSAGGTV